MKPTALNLVLLQEEGKEAILQLRSSALWHLSLEMSTRLMLVRCSAHPHEALGHGGIRLGRRLSHLCALWHALRLRESGVAWA